MRRPRTEDHGDFEVWLFAASDYYVIIIAVSISVRLHHHCHFYLASHFQISSEVSGTARLPNLWYDFLQGD